MAELMPPNPTSEKAYLAQWRRQALLGLPLECDRFFRTSRDAQAAAVAAFRKRCVGLLAAMGPQLEATLPTQVALVRRAQDTEGKHAIGAHCLAGPLGFAALAV